MPAAEGVREGCNRISLLLLLLWEWLLLPCPHLGELLMHRAGAGFKGGPGPILFIWLLLITKITWVK